MNEETLLQIKEEDLFDLTEMAYGNKFRGMYPSAGGCDEVRNGIAHTTRVNLLRSSFACSYTDAT